MAESDQNPQYYARYNQNLHAIARRRYHRLHTVASLLAAITASASLAATFGEQSGLWQSLIALSALCSIIGPILRWSDLEAMHGAMSMAYRQLEWRLDSLTIEQAREELARLEAQETHVLPIGWASMEKDADLRTRNQLNISQIVE